MNAAAAYELQTPDRSSRIDPAERGVLGGLMSDNRELANVQDWLHADAFYFEAHREIYRAMLAHAAANKQFDALVLEAALAGNEAVEERGGSGFIYGLQSYCINSKNVASYAEIVMEESRLRTVADTGRALISAIQSPQGRSVVDIIGPALATLSAMQTGAERGGLRPVKPALQRWYQQLSDRYYGKKKITGLPTPWHDINELTFGLQPGTLTIVGGRPGMGKSVIGFQLSAFTALRGLLEGHGDVARSALFSLEMSAEEMLERTLSALSEAPYAWLRSPASDLDADHFPSLTLPFQQLLRSQLLIDDEGQLTVQQIAARARREHLRSPLALIVVDHIHIVKVKGTNIVYEIGQVTATLKALAKELRIPIVALAQLNRANQARVDKRPTMSDLRESGNIEQDADLILLPHREDYYRADKNDHDHAIEVIVAKGRNVPTSGSIWLYERFDIMRCDDWRGARPVRRTPSSSKGPSGKDLAAGIAE